MEALKNKGLIQTATRLLAADRGLLAMDESIKTCNDRFHEIGIPETIEYRRKYRELIVTTPGIEQFISGAILCDETIRQTASDGTLIADILIKKGIIPGIKVDNGTIPMAMFPDEKTTEGLDGLASRLENYRQLGAGFAKWRAVIKIGPGIPTSACMRFNAQLLARYAAQCQEALLVPVVEPEVLMDGSHSMDTCAKVTGEFLKIVFAALYEHRVNLAGMLLKPNMVLPGSTNVSQPTAGEVAMATVSCLLGSVPTRVPGMVFLSGGQAAQLATERLNAMNKSYRQLIPWTLSFSFSRAILQPALRIWSGNDKNVAAAQQELLHRAKCNHAACQGIYHPGLETK